MSLTGCQKSLQEPIPSESSSTPAESVEGSPQETPEGSSEESKPEPEPSEESTVLFDTSGTIEETDLYNENDVRVTATGLSYSDSAVTIELTIENNSDKNLSFIAGSLGYSCNSVNGFMVDDGYLNCDVNAGKKANDTIRISYDALRIYGISAIADMEIGIDICDEEYNHIYTGPRQIRTSIADTYEYKETGYQESLTNELFQKAYGYSLPFFAADVLYEQNGVRVISEALAVKGDETVLFLEVENSSGETVNLSSSDIAVNGLSVSSSTWSTETINPAKRRVMEIDLTSVFDANYWPVYGIEEVGLVKLALTQKDVDGNALTEPAEIQVGSADAAASFDSAGTEIYNQNGVRFVYKGLVPDSSEYSGNMHILLLAENTSGRTLSIGDSYNSLSVNGFMTDYSLYSTELKDGACAVMDILLWEHSLEENKIASVSEVSEIELQLDIREGYETVDNPTITITV